MTDTQFHAVMYAMMSLVTIVSLVLLTPIIESRIAKDCAAMGYHRDGDTLIKCEVIK